MAAVESDKVIESLFSGHEFFFGDIEVLTPKKLISDAKVDSTSPYFIEFIGGVYVIEFRNQG